MMTASVWLRSDRLTLAAVPSAVSCSRAFVQDTLHRWGLDSLIHTAEVVTAELVANSVWSVGTMDGSLRCAVLGLIQCIQVRLDLAESLFVEVWDRDERSPVLAGPGTDAGNSGNGPGIRAVGALSTRWGYSHPQNGGKIVWCELELPGDVAVQRLDMGLLERVLVRLRAFTGEVEAIGGLPC